MTLRSVISFRPSALLLPILICSVLSAASVTGSVTLTDSNNSAVKKKNDYADVVVWLSPLTDDPMPLPKKRAELLQKDKKFTPHLLVVSAGTSVDFPNLDPIFHNAFSNFDGQIFDIGLYAPGSSRAVRFDRPGIVRIFCNIHPSMSAIIVVVDTPYFTTTDDTGKFSFQNIPPGAYRIHFFHERATPETLDKLGRTVSVNQAPIKLASVTISETGYLPVAHKNKYGRDYPASADEQHTYALPLK
jgi:plastocyanin